MAVPLLRWCWLTSVNEWLIETVCLIDSKCRFGRSRNDLQFHCSTKQNQGRNPRHWASIRLDSSIPLAPSFLRIVAPALVTIRVSIFSPASVRFEDQLNPPALFGGSSSITRPVGLTTGQLQMTPWESQTKCPATPGL
jgi:hypothetical protein